MVFFCLMHGAMYVEGIDDPEGEWIRSVREAVGHRLYYFSQL